MIERDRNETRFASSWDVFMLLLWGSKAMHVELEAGTEIVGDIQQQLETKKCWEGVDVISNQV